MKMGARRKKVRADKKKVAMVLKMDQKLEVMGVNGNQFFPCRTCNRLFKDKLEAIGHIQACKPDDFPSSNVLVPQEANTNDKMNNNYIQIDKANISIRNIERLRKRITKCNYAVVPKKRNIKKRESTVDHDNISTEAKTLIQSCTIDKPVHTRKRGKKLSEEEIAERLRRISDRLKKKEEVKVPFDDEEEDERQEIEDRLMALNKDSGISYLDDYPDLDDRLRDEDDARLELKNSAGVAKKRGVENLKTESAILNSSGNLDGIIIVTQKPDGQMHGCPKCTEVFVSELELFRHKRDKHTAPKIIMAPDEIKKYYDVSDKTECPICKRTFGVSNKTVFMKHLQSHTYVGEYECPVCKKKFKRKDHMRMHEKRHIV